MSEKIINGSREIRRGNVVLAAITEAEADKLETVWDEYKKFKGESDNAEFTDGYQSFYWLCRYSDFTIERREQISELEKEIAELKAREDWKFVEKDGLPQTVDKSFLTTTEIQWNDDVFRIVESLRFWDGVWFDKNNKPLARNAKVIAYCELPAPAKLESEK